MERAQDGDQTDLNSEFGSATYHLWDAGQVQVLLQALLCSSVKWAQWYIVRDIK